MQIRQEPWLFLPLPHSQPGKNRPSRFHRRRAQFLSFAGLDCAFRLRLARDFPFVSARSSNASPRRTARSIILAASVFATAVTLSVLTGASFLTRW